MLLQVGRGPPGLLCPGPRGWYDDLGRSVMEVGGRAGIFLSQSESGPGFFVLSSLSLLLSSFGFDRVFPSE